MVVSSSGRHERRRVLSATAVAAVVLLAGAACATDPPPSGETPGSTATLAIDGQVVTASVPTGTTVTLAPANPVALPTAPAGLAFPFGPVDLNVQQVTPGSVVHVTVVLSSKVDSVRKLIDGNWDPFYFDGTTGATVSPDGLTITLNLKDGGRGDADGVENGTIVDPWVAVNATSLLITTIDVPTVHIGSPYSTQLQAAGATGTVHWTAPGGSLSPGLTLSDSGLISGTPTGSSFLAQVQATDDVATASKLLLFGTFATTGQPTATGQPLPDGTSVFFGAMDGSDCPDGCYTWVGRYLHDGTVSAIETTSVNTYLAVVGGSGAVNTAGTRAVTYTIPSTPGPATGPVEVIDADTGSPIHTLEESPSFNVRWVSFSPNGAYLALADASGSTRIFETNNWTVTRTMQLWYSGSNLGIWSPDSTRIASTSGAEVTVFSVSDQTGASDYTFNVSGQNSCSSSDWSATTGRLALTCATTSPGYYSVGTVVSLSSADGSDARIVASGSCSPSECVSYGFSGPFVKFSPHGAYLVIGESTYDPSAPTNGSSSRIGYSPDSTGGSVTYLTDPLPFAGTPGGYGVSFTFPATWS